MSETTTEPTQRAPVDPVAPAHLPSFRHLTSTKQVTQADARLVLRTSQEMQDALHRHDVPQVLKRRVMASLFYEPSTRTRLSFEMAMMRLGGRLMTADGFQFSSLYKGETVRDNTRTVCALGADIIVMRHPTKGSADDAAAVSTAPFINAGDGPGQHPSQAFLDLFTIKSEVGRTEDLHVAFVGDLRNGRTVHSLVYLLGLFPKVRFTFVSPAELSIPRKVRSFLVDHGIPFTEDTELEAALGCDVIYMTRIQKERFPDQSEYELVKGVYCLRAAHLHGRSAIVMHPLPRVDEIAEDVDALPNAAYFRQVASGVPTRMALLQLLIEREDWRRQQLAA